MDLVKERSILLLRPYVILLLLYSDYSAGQKCKGVDHHLPPISVGLNKNTTMRRQLQPFSEHLALLLTVPKLQVSLQLVYHLPYSELIHQCKSFPV